MNYRIDVYQNGGVWHAECAHVDALPWEGRAGRGWLSDSGAFRTEAAALEWLSGHVHLHVGEARVRSG